MPDTCRMKLTAREGTPLADDAVARTVIATAHAIAERTGVPLLEIVHDERSVTVRLAADKLAGLGFLAELRRLTNNWFAARGGTLAGTPEETKPELWGDPPKRDGDDDPDPWSTPFDAWDDE